MIRFTNEDEFVEGLKKLEKNCGAYSDACVQRFEVVIGQNRPRTLSMSDTKLECSEREDRVLEVFKLLYSHPPKSGWFGTSCEAYKEGGYYPITVTILVDV